MEVIIGPGVEKEDKGAVWRRGRLTSKSMAVKRHLHGGDGIPTRRRDQEMD